MKNDNTHKSSLFLMELIIAIAFFTIASAVCLQLFVKSHLLGNKTRELNAAVNLAVSAAESFRQCGGSEDELLALFPESVQTTESSLKTYYNDTFQTCKKEDATYTMTILLSEDKGFASAKILIKDIEASESIYEVTVQTHLANTI